MENDNVINLKLVAKRIYDFIEEVRWREKTRFIETVVLEKTQMKRRVMIAEAVR